MKKHLLFFSLLIAAGTSFAQIKQPTVQHLQTHRLATNNKKVDEEYTIKLKTAPTSTYLYHIYKSGKKIHVPPANPVTGLPTGFATPEQAYAAAGWAIALHRQKGTIPPTMPLHTARKLGLHQSAILR